MNEKKKVVEVEKLKEELRISRDLWKADGKRQIVDDIFDEVEKYIDSLAVEREPLPIETLAEDQKALPPEVNEAVNEHFCELVGEPEQPEMICPKCGAVHEDFDGFGVLHCDKCGYCVHPSTIDGVCGLCGKSMEPVEMDTLVKARENYRKHRYEIYHSEVTQEGMDAITDYIGILEQQAEALKARVG